jgi:membrane protein YfhO
VNAFFHHYRLANVEFWLPLAAVACAAACWSAYHRRRLSPAAFGTALVLLTVTDLEVLGRRLVPQCDLQKYPLQPAAAVLKPLESERELFRVHHWGPNSEYLFRPNWLMACGLQDLWGNFSLAPETVERLPFYTNDQFNAILDLANVKYMLTLASFSLPTNRFELVLEADGARLYRNLRCLPRLQFYGQWQVVPDRRKLLEVMTADTFAPQETVLLEEPPKLTNASANASATIKVERYTANHVIARVNATGAGVLLLADTWYPGWKALVDGQSAPLYRADHALRATVVPGGEHEVEFVYAPPLFRTGATVSLAAAAGAILLAFVFRKKN